MRKRKFINRIVLVVVLIIFGLFFFIFPLGLNDLIRINNNIVIEGNKIRKNIPDILRDPEYVNKWLKNSKTPENLRCYIL
ncbi:hypothetical protein BXU10_10835 [Flavobacterium sp. LM4]|nr:hypothetical protein BXU10_10835 [Flavobacterium sp. LM4]